MRIDNRQQRLCIAFRYGDKKNRLFYNNTHALAVQLGINVNTVARVYRDLQTSGHLRLKRGVGNVVADGVDRPVAKRDVARLSQQVDKIIRISREAGITCAELTRFITTRWKEGGQGKRGLKAAADALEKQGTSAAAKRT